MKIVLVDDGEANADGRTAGNDNNGADGGSSGNADVDGPAADNDDNGTGNNCGGTGNDGDDL